MYSTSSYCSYRKSTDLSSKVFIREAKQRSAFRATNESLFPDPEKGFCEELKESSLDCWRSIWQFILGVEVEDDAFAEDLDLSTVLRRRPQEINSLCETTKFSKPELQHLYRTFKENCPSGALSLERFKEIYSAFFPSWKVKAGAENDQYATYLFKTVDLDCDGIITFESISVFSRGTFEETVEWLFRLYDLDQNGVITRSDMSRLIQSIHELMGESAYPAVCKRSIQTHVDQIFQKMDTDKDGEISLDDFMSACRQDDVIHASFESLYNVASSTVGSQQLNYENDSKKSLSDKLPNQSFNHSAELLQMELPMKNAVES